MSGSMALQQQGSVLMSVAPDNFRINVNGTILVSEGLPATGVMTTLVACAATWGQAWAAAVGHDWVHGPTAAKVWPDVWL